MPKSHLVPEQRTDKNGVTSTRWVKPASGSSPVKKMPSPALQPEAVDTPFFDQFFSRHNSGAIFPLHKQDFDQSALTAIDSLLEKAQGEQGNESTNLALFIETAFKQYSADEDHKWINNIAALGESVAFSGSLAEKSISYYVNGLHRNGLFTSISDFHLEATDEERSQAAALCRITNILPGEHVDESLGYNEFDPDDNISDHEDDDEYDYYLAIKPELGDLIEFVMNHHEQVDEIAGIMKERDTVDVGVLTEILGNKTQALREGTL